LWPLLFSAVTYIVPMREILAFIISVATICCSARKITPLCRHCIKEALLIKKKWPPILIKIRFITALAAKKRQKLIFQTEWSWLKVIRFCSVQMDFGVV